MDDKSSEDVGGCKSVSERAHKEAPHQKLFKKCKSATFHLDGATYTIGNCIF